MKSLLVFNGRDIKVILSLQATDLLSKMLTFQPSLRITASEALSHPYFADFGVSPHDLSSSSSANTTRYQRTTSALSSSRHHICQKIYATAILGLKNLRKKNGICDKTSSGQNNVNALKWPLIAYLV